MFNLFAAILGILIFLYLIGSAKKDHPSPYLCNCMAAIQIPFIIFNILVFLFLF